MKVTWKGEPGGPDEITQYGVVFERKVPSEVPANHPQMAKFRGNPFFVVEDDEPAAPASNGSLFKAVHKGRGVWMVTGPDGTPDYGPYNKDEAAAKLYDLNEVGG